jgi:pimeloyl-ACP methyl ester carboxylesterase
MKSKKIFGFFSILVIVLSLATLINSVQAATTEITGDLGGAGYRIRIPDNWQQQGGNVVIACRGYSPTVPTSWSQTNYLMLLAQGYMVAESNYGTGGYCVKEGIIRTHQLTEYILDHYPVEGRVLLMGVSMGGNIALELGVKYPDLYAGVLDICGSKDLAPQYNDKIAYAALTNDAELQAALIAKQSSPTPFPFWVSTTAFPTTFPTLHDALQGFRGFSATSAEDIKTACGGYLPEEKPKEYQKISPTYSASDLKIPTITVHGTKDGLVPYAQSVAFKAAVEANGDSDLYRLYTVTNGEHANNAVAMKIPVCIPILLAWVNGVSVAPTTTPWPT